MNVSDNEMLTEVGDTFIQYRTKKSVVSKLHSSKNDMDITGIQYKKKDGSNGKRTLILKER